MRIVDYSKPGAHVERLISDLAELQAFLVRMDNRPDADTITEAMDILADYEKIADQNGKMIVHFQKEEKPILSKNGVWCCPSCGKRVNYHHTHCHWCGKKMGWQK